MLRVFVQFLWLSQNNTDRVTYEEMPLTVMDGGSPIDDKVLASREGLLVL